MHDNDDVQWYAVHTLSRCEDLAERSLKAKGYPTFFPHTPEWVGKDKYRLRLVKRPYLSRYMFVGLTAQHHVGGCPNLYPINDANGVATVVYAPGGIPFPINPVVMEELMERADPLGAIMGKPKKHPRFKGRIGDYVKLSETTAYFGFLAEVARIDDNGKLLILLETFGRKVPTLIRPEDVSEVIAKGDPRLCDEAPKQNVAG
jgi:transcription antitermination factor NusG